MHATVLLVEDSSDLRRVFTRCLSIQGFVVVQAVDGQDALDTLERITPDLILTDLMMPRLDGLELIRRVRAIPHLADIAIVVITAVDTDDVGIAVREAGASALLGKPIDVLEIARNFVDLCRGTTPGDGLSSTNPTSGE